MRSMLDQFIITAEILISCLIIHLSYMNLWGCVVSIRAGYVTMIPALRIGK